MLKLVLLATVGAWIGFSNPLFHFPLAILAFPLGLAWIGLRATSGPKAFRFGWLAGTLAATGCFYWMVIPVQAYGGLPWFVALPCPALLAAFIGLYFGLFSLSMHYAGKRIDGVPLCLLAGFSWAAMEMLMGSVLSGFPWLNLASGFAPWPALVQGASVIGAYGLSGVFAALAVAALLCSTYRSALALAVGLAALIVGFGFYRTATFDVGERDYTVAVVQGNVDQGLKWNPQYQADTVKKYAQLSLEAIAKDSPALLVWPETAMPFYLQEDTGYRKALELLANDTGSAIITGSPAYRVIDAKTRSYVLYNRAWLIDSSGHMTQSYDKEHLVPFGEYMPLEKWVPFKKLVQAAGNFKPGEDNRPLKLNGVALGMLICYEAIFPDLAQQQVERGASVLVNISNDAWFGDTSAPGQHLDLAVMRAVEQGRWLVRSTNTGISAFVDPLGRLAGTTRQFEAGTLSMKIAALQGKTVYHAIRDRLNAFIYVMTVAAFGYLAFASRRKKGTIE